MILMSISVQEMFHLYKKHKAGGALKESVAPVGISVSCVAELVFVLRGGAGVRGRGVPVDGRRDAAAELAVVGQRQVQEAGARGQVDVLNVLHVRPANRTQLKEGRQTC